MSEMVEKVARAICYASEYYDYGADEDEIFTCQRCVSPADCKDWHIHAFGFTRQARAAIEATPLEKYRQALESIRDIEKPMCGEHPETDWLSWYSTSSQQEEIARTALKESEQEQ